MCCTGAADAAAHSVSAGQRRHRDVAASTRRCGGLHHQGPLLRTAHRRQGGPRRGNVPYPETAHGPY